MDQDKKRFMFLTLFYSIPLILIYYVYILLVLPCIPTYIHAHCIFVRSHIETNRVTGEDEGLFTTNVEEEIQRCMLLLLFHIPLFIISFIVCIFVLLVLLLFT